MENMGRPPIYNSPEEMAQKILEYFEWIKGEETLVATEGKEGLQEWKRQPEPVTITGLCIYLGFESRQSFYDYGDRADFSYIINKARLLVENGYEKKLSAAQVAGAIFALKNMGWKDRTESDVNLKGNIHLEFIPDPNSKPLGYEKEY